MSSPTPNFKIEKDNSPYQNDETNMISNDFELSNSRPMLDNLNSPGASSVKNSGNSLFNPDELFQINDKSSLNNNLMMQK